ncbi:MAG: helix-turn-helix domain-containing protein [Haloechinothrix sp.]
MNSSNIVPLFSCDMAEDAPYMESEQVIDPHRATYTVMEVAYLLNLSRGVTYQYVREGVIPAQRIGRRWVIPRRSFHHWLDSREAVI